ncbi:hypothetical protein EGW08_018858 [Elysia chlorotica]|uniref:Uncharacterized protein n=1 Tax=Elysia chlorotica TaxID=188477 RepID=A0A433SVQ8_ELYCH|nr:hypothetical protein EGW08_018858 [Elysia chlorotica]
MAQYSEVYTVLEAYEAALILLLGFGVMSVGLALLYNFIRRRVFNEANSLDRTFDAGGNVSFSLTAVTVAVQLLWPADLLQSSSVASKYGIAGGFWYSTAVVVNIILFPFLSITFKTRAPGAKTYLQVIKARFGAPAHLVYSVFALMVNLVILSVLIIAGHALFTGLVKDISDELIMLIFATLFGSYSLVGGLGSTFYVSYANALITFVILSVFIIEMFYLPDKADLPFGTLKEIYDKVAILEGPKDNEDRSYLTFWSLDSMVWAIQGVFIAASVTFCDQASWQSRIAAKPMQGVVGFFFATFLWFAIPATLGTTSGIVYLAYSEGGNLSTALSDSDIDKGLITPYIAQIALGRGGGVMVLIMFTMLMMATGSGEVMGVSSIIVYDIYQSYVKPFRPKTTTGSCVMCGKQEKGETIQDLLQTDETVNSVQNNSYIIKDSYQLPAPLKDYPTSQPNDTERNETTQTQNSLAGNGSQGNGREENMCECLPVSDCPSCQDDLERMVESQKSALGQYHKAVTSCPQHGQYRMYQEELIRVKSWVLLCVTIGLVPGGLLLVRTGIDLNWIFMTGCIVTIQAFPGVVLSIVWVKTTGIGLIIGGILGMISGVCACLARAATLEGGLSDFLANTSEGYAVMAGSSVCFFVSLIVGVGVSWCTHRIKTAKDENVEWQKVRDIDNKLSPWSDMYRDEFPQLPRNQRPTYQQLNACFRRAKLVAVVGSILCLLLFIIIIPGAMAALHVMSSDEFQAFIMFLQVWTLIMAVAIILLVPVEETMNIVKQLRRKTGVS